MWYLYMIAGLYMLVPFFRKIVEDEKLYRYFLKLAFLFAFVIPTIISFVTVFSKENADYIRGIIGKMYMFFVMGYSFYFMSGYILNQRNFTKREVRGILWTGGFGFIFTFLLSVWASWSAGKESGLFFENFTLNVMAEGIAVFVLCKKYYERIKINDRQKRILAALSTYSFEAYLIHALVIDVLRNCFHLHSLTFSPVLSIPVLSLLVFVISYLISGTLNRIRYRIKGI